MTTFAKVLITPTIQLSSSYFMPLHTTPKFLNCYVKLFILSLFCAYCPSMCHKGFGLLFSFCILFETGNDSLLNEVAP